MNEQQKYTKIKIFPFFKFANVLNVEQEIIDFLEVINENDLTCKYIFREDYIAVLYNDTIGK